MEDDSAATVAVGTLIGRAELWIEACSEEINHDAGQARIQVRFTRGDAAELERGAGGNELRHLEALEFLFEVEARRVLGGLP